MKSNLRGLSRTAWTYALLGSLLSACVGEVGDLGSGEVGVGESESALGARCANDPNRDQSAPVNGVASLLRDERTWDGFGRSIVVESCSRVIQKTIGLPRLGATPLDAPTITFGPYSGWKAVDIRPLPDGRTALLFAHPNGQASLWTLNREGAYERHRYYGPSLPWMPTSYFPRANGTALLMWSQSNGQTSIWELDTSGNYVRHYTLQGSNGWTAVHVQELADGTAKVLFRHTSGQASIWTLDTSKRYVRHVLHGPYSGWRPVSLDRQADGTSHLLWQHTSGQVNLWQLNANDSYRAHVTLATTTFSAAAHRRVNALESLTLWNTSDGRTHISTSRRLTRFADVDGDRSADVVDVIGNRLEVLRSAMGHTNPVRSSHAELTGARSVDIADSDSNGLDDLVVEVQAGGIRVLRSLGNGTFTLTAPTQASNFDYYSSAFSAGNSNGLVRITSVSPPQPTPGMEVRITGTGFNLFLSPVVLFGRSSNSRTGYETAGRITQRTATEIRAIVPEGAVDGPVRVVDQLVHATYPPPTCIAEYSTTRAPRIVCTVGNPTTIRLDASGGNLTILRPPAAPTYLNIRAVSANEIHLRWNDSSNNEQGFRLEVYDGAQAQWIAVADQPANTNYVEIQDLAPRTPYSFRVRAFLGGLVSDPSPAASAATLQPNTLEFRLSSTTAFPNGTREIANMSIRFDENRDRRILGESVPSNEINGVTYVANTLVFVELTSGELVSMFFYWDNENRLTPVATLAQSGPDSVVFSAEIVPSIASTALPADSVSDFPATLDAVVESHVSWIYNGELQGAVRVRVAFAGPVIAD